MFVSKSYIWQTAYTRAQILCKDSKNSLTYNYFRNYLTNNLQHHTRVFKTKARSQSQLLAFKTQMVIA